MIQFDSNIFPQAQGVYIIGGSIRDLLLGRVPTDYDIVVTENPAKFAGRVAARTNGHLVTLGKPGQMLFRVISGTDIIDIAPLNGVSIETDLLQRDFTVNAMAYDLFSKKIIDPLGGLSDLDHKKVRMVAKQAFVKDPIRMLRAFRIGACLNFNIDPLTISAIATDAGLIQKSAGERVRAELFKLLNNSNSFNFITQMADTGLLLAIFPELKSLKGCRQNRYHQFDVFEHTMQAYRHLESMLADLGKYLPETWQQTLSDPDQHRLILLKCAILLHDIGKPAAKTLDDRGVVHFYGHAQKSADMAKKISRQLKFATREIDFIDFIIRNHIRPLSLFIAHQKQTLTDKGLTRFFMKCGHNSPYLLLHTIADIKGKQNKTKTENQAFIAFVKALINDFFSSFYPQSKTPPLITGRDLIDEFQLTPSPLFKKILNGVEEAKLSNTINSKAEAITWVREFLSKGKTVEK